MEECNMDWWIKIWNFQFKVKTVCKKYDWRADMYLKPTVKHEEGSVMVWRRLTANSVGNLVRVDRIINAEKYR